MKASMWLCEVVREDSGVRIRTTVLPGARQGTNEWSN